MAVLNGRPHSGVRVAHRDVRVWVFDAPIRGNGSYRHLVLTTAGRLSPQSRQFSYGGQITATLYKGNAMHLVGKRLTARSTSFSPCLDDTMRPGGSRPSRPFKFRIKCVQAYGWLGLGRPDGKLRC